MSCWTRRSSPAWETSSKTKCSSAPGRARFNTPDEFRIGSCARFSLTPAYFRCAFWSSEESSRCGRIWKSTGAARVRTAEERSTDACMVNAAGGVSSAPVVRRCRKAASLFRPTPLFAPALELVERPRPVGLQQPRQGTVGKQSPLGLTGGTVVDLVLAVHDSLHRRAARRAGFSNRPCTAIPSLKAVTFLEISRRPLPESATSIHAAFLALANAHRRGRRCTSVLRTIEWRRYWPGEFYGLVHQSVDEPIPVVG